jgi:DNA ligase D-like protein (predicted polymerase)
MSTDRIASGSPIAGAVIGDETTGVRPGRPMPIAWRGIPRTGPRSPATRRVYACLESRAPLDLRRCRREGGGMSGAGETRDGVVLTNLDRPLFDGADATKRDLVDYLDAIRDRFIPVLSGRPLSVIRVLRGQAPFMQKNVPGYAPDWVATASVWAETSRREVSYALCDDRRTLLWFANQRAVEYHPTLLCGGRPTHLVLDIDPPSGGGFARAVRAARLVREVLTDVGMEGVVKTSGAKGVHVFVPLDATATADDAAAATRAVAARAERLDPVLATTAFIREDRGGRVFLDSTRAGGATVVAAYSPRVRPGVPVSFPLAWEDLDRAGPADFTLNTAARLLAGADPWRELMPAPQRLDPGLVAEGRTIPAARVQALHEGRRRARARRGQG